MTYTSGAPSPPSNNSLPTISGSAIEGQTLTEAHGAWANGPTSYSYQWEDCNSSGASCVTITGESGQTHVLTARDVAHTIRVQETASNAAGSGPPAISTQTVPVLAASSTGGGGGSPAGGGRGSPTGVAGASVSLAQIAAGLARQITPTGKTARIGSLLQRGGFSFAFTALAAGVAIVDWYQLPPGAHLAKKRKPTPLLVAAGRLTFRTAGRAKMTVKLTAAGKHLLKNAKRLSLTGKATFTPTHRTAVTRYKTFTLGR